MLTGSALLPNPAINQKKCGRNQHELKPLRKHSGGRYFRVQTIFEVKKQLPLRNITSSYTKNMDFTLLISCWLPIGKRRNSDQRLFPRIRVDIEEEENNPQGRPRIVQIKTI